MKGMEMHDVKDIKSKKKVKTAKYINMLRYSKLNALKCHKRK